MCLTKPIKTCTNPALHVLIRASTDSLNSHRMGHLHHDWLQCLLAVSHSHVVIFDRCLFSPHPPMSAVKIRDVMDISKTRVLKSAQHFNDQSGKRNRSTGANRKLRHKKQTPLLTRSPWPPGTIECSGDLKRMTRNRKMSHQRYGSGVAYFSELRYSVGKWKETHMSNNQGCFRLGRNESKRFLN